MRRSGIHYITILCMIILLMTVVSSGANVIGIFGDLEGVTCDVDVLTPYAYVNIYFIALLTDINAIGAAEFGAVGVDWTGSAIATVAWNTTLVIGDIMSPDGVALAFPAPLEGPVAALGSIEYFVLAPFAMDAMASVVPSGTGNLVLVDADSGAELPAEGWSFLFNCTGDCECPASPPSEHIGIAISSPQNDDPIEGLYALSFSVSSTIDEEGANFSGTVSRDGIDVESFSGFGTGVFEYQHSSEDQAHGSTHEILIIANNSRTSNSASVSYTIEDSQPPSTELQTPPDQYQFNGGTLILEAMATDFQGTTGMIAEFYIEEAGSTEPVNPPILTAPSDDGTFTGSHDIFGDSPSEFDVGVIVVDAAGNRSDYMAHTVYFYPLNYRISFDVDHPQAHDWGAVAGVLLGATDEYDPAIDLPEPPTPPLNYVTCYFPHPEWDSPFGDRFNADVREDTDFMGLQKVWDFIIETDLVNEEFEISFSADPAFIDSLPTYIVDVDLVEYHNLHEIDDFTFNSGESGVRHFQLVIGPSESLPGFVEAEFFSGWNMAGLPLDPVSSSALDILYDDLGDSYFLYEYSEATGYLPSSQMTPNRGYWLGLFSDATIDVHGSALVDTISTQLLDPWQMVSTSLYKNIALDQTRVRNGYQVLPFDDAAANGWISPAVYGWNAETRAYVVADTLELWQGYWVGQLVDGLQMLFHKDWGYVPIGGGAPAPDPIAGWRVGIEASSPEITERVYLGMHPEANRGFDVAFDYPKPPIAPGGSSIYLSFDHSDWRCVLGDHFNRDIRSNETRATAERWNLRVQTENESTILTWPFWSQGIPDDLDFLLDDLGTPEHEWVDLRHDDRIELLGAGVHHLSIAVGEGLTTSTTQTLPLAHALLGSHPNPFNPSTKIAFALKSDAKVHLAIYSSDGRLINILVDEHLAPGHHHAIWRGKDIHGNDVSSGVYLTRLEIEGSAFSGKLMLLK